MKPLIIYFSLAYIISWIIWLPLYAPYFGISGIPVLPYQHGLGGLGPLIASFITTGILYKQAGLKELFKRCIKVRPLLYLIIALASPFILLLIASIINFIFNGSTLVINDVLTVKEFPQFNLFIFFIYNMIFFGFGEETGWRGFALARLQNKLNALNASLVLTFFWAIWHIPLFFYRPGYAEMDAGGILGWLLSLLTGSILLTWFYNSSGGSILICAVFHSTIDIAFTADIPDTNIINYMGFLITIWGILTIVFYKPKNLARKERVKLSNQLSRF